MNTAAETSDARGGRRAFLKKAAVGAGAAWVAPTVLSIAPAAAISGTCPSPTVSGPLGATGSAVTFNATPTVLGAQTLFPAVAGGTASVTGQAIYWMNEYIGPAPTATSPNGAGPNGGWMTDNGQGGTGVEIVPGTMVCVWLLHYAPTTDAVASGVFTAPVGTQILGFDHRNPYSVRPGSEPTTLCSGDPVWPQNPNGNGLGGGVTYPTCNGSNQDLYARRSMEPTAPPQGDAVNCPPNQALNNDCTQQTAANQLTVRMFTDTTRVDEIRVYMTQP